MSLSRVTAVAPRRTVVAFSLAAALISLAGCNQNLDMEVTRQSISEGLSKQLELEIASVTCPTEGRPLKAGDTFECTATPKAGGSISVKVTQKDDAGNINWEVAKSEGLFDMRLLESTVQKGLAEQTGTEATVSCGAPWQVGKEGDVFECEVKTADGAVSTAVVTVKDAQGNVGWSIGEASTEEASSEEAPSEDAAPSEDEE